MRCPAHRGRARDMGVKDPVCGMEVESTTARGGSVVHRGVSFHFCSPRCAEKFRADPDRYAAGIPVGDSPSPPRAVEKAQYTCPMHPEIVRDAPGSCPICGMALEPTA